MQFIPSTWATYAADGNNDGVKDPENIDDATLAAADYLCTASDGLNKPKGLIRAVYAYNHSYSYVKAVLTVAAHYENINPAKLGINGLPKDKLHKKHALRLRITAPNPKASHSASPTPSPTQSASPTPTPTPTESASPPPTPTPTPKPTRSHRPKPAPTGTPGGGHLPGH